MITLENIWTKAGHTNHDHMLPNAEDVFADLIGQQFASLRDIRDAIARNASTYTAPNGRTAFARDVAMGAEIRHASGRLLTVDV